MVKFHPQPNTRRSLPTIHDYPALVRRLDYYRDLVDDFAEGSKEQKVCEAIIRDTCDLVRAIQKNENEAFIGRPKRNFLMRFNDMPFITPEDWKKFWGYFRVKQYLP